MLGHQCHRIHVIPTQQGLSSICVGRGGQSHGTVLQLQRHGDGVWKTRAHQPLPNLPHHPGESGTCGFSIRLDFWHFCLWYVRSGCVSRSSFFELMKTSPRFGATKVVYVGQLPDTKYKEEDVLQLAESFGKVRKYLFNRIRREVISTSVSEGTRCGLHDCLCVSVL